MHQTSGISTSVKQSVSRKGQEDRVGRLIWEIAELLKRDFPEGQRFHYCLRGAGGDGGEERGAGFRDEMLLALHKDLIQLPRRMDFGTYDVPCEGGLILSLTTPSDNDFGINIYAED